MLGRCLKGVRRNSWVNIQEASRAKLACDCREYGVDKCKWGNAHRGHNHKQTRQPPVWYSVKWRWRGLKTPPFLQKVHFLISFLTYEILLLGKKCFII